MWCSLVAPGFGGGQQPFDKMGWHNFIIGFASDNEILPWLEHIEWDVIILIFAYIIPSSFYVFIIDAKRISIFPFLY